MRVPSGQIALNKVNFSDDRCLELQLNLREPGLRSDSMKRKYPTTTESTTIGLKKLLSGKFPGITA